MLIREPKRYEIPYSAVTPQSLYVNRRDFIKSSGLMAGGLALGAGLGTIGLGTIGLGGIPQAQAAVLPNLVKSKYNVDEKQTPFEAVTTYNNFYEFGTDKSDPSENAKGFVTKPWSITVDGEVAHPGTYALEDLLKGTPVEERVYRMRCVEAWSMVIPWAGVPLAAIIEKLGPTSKAKYIAFETLYDPKRMPGERVPVLEWPYREGLRMDEAMNPLALLAVGLYGQSLLPQNGAPIRLVLPWKYGFKGIKSITKIHFTDRQPRTAWNISAPNEYGFLANVNPTVDHPRWSQATERRIGEFFRRPTLMFNGYGPEVAQLYKGIDLRKYF